MASKIFHFFGRIAFFFSLLILFNFQNTALADGFIVPQFGRIIPPVHEAPYFSVKYHHVNTEINNQFAVTKVDQVFKNESNRTLEGTYLFPIPDGAAINDFSMYMGKQKVKGAIFTKEEARRIYDEIVRKRKDPALLEYINQGVFKASIFPIPAYGESRTELKYEELTRLNNNVYKYVYTLSTEKFSPRPLEEVKININLKTDRGLKSVYSPTHDINVTRINEKQASVSFTEKNSKPVADFILYYTVSEQDIGLNLLTYSDPEEKKDFFLMLASPKYEAATEDIVPKNMVFILDTSGSMSGEKIEQARNALKFCVQNLNKQDKFSLITFSDDVEVYKNRVLDSSAENKRQALKFIDTIEASGGTNISEAMAKGLNITGNSKLPTSILFLTDGQPTVGETDTNNILKKLKSTNKKAHKLFVFGVGFDVNIQFLDKMSAQNHGYSEYVRPEENIENTVSSLFSKINMPVLTGLKFTYSGVKVSEVYPVEIPDLFKGSQVVLLGRYDRPGKATVKLSGKVADKTKVFNYPVIFSKNLENDFIPRLWASRKIGYLLDEIRLKGQNQELIDEVIRLSKKYGIITEFTSFLVREDVPLTSDISEYRDKVQEQMESALDAESGSWAIGQSRNAAKLKNQAVQAPNSYIDKEGNTVEMQNKVQNIADKSFFQKKNQWVDSSFKEENVLKIKLFSRAYFELSDKIKEINKFLALGEEVFVNIRGQNIQVGSTGQEELTDKQRRLLKM